MNEGDLNVSLNEQEFKESVFEEREDSAADPQERERRREEFLKMLEDRQ